MAINYAALKTELQTDPQTYGYAAALAAGEPETVAALLNKVRNGTDGEAAITINRTTISPTEVLRVITVGDFRANLTNMAASWFESVTQYGTLQLRDAQGASTPTRDNFIALFSNGSATLTRLAALETRNGSRAEQLYGEGTVITPQDIATAMRS